jgi:hypothetical protein
LAIFLLYQRLTAIIIGFSKLKKNKHSKDEGKGEKGKTGKGIIIIGMNLVNGVEAVFLELV